MPKKIDMIGKRFGRLLVIEESKIRKSHDKIWLCKCDCGTSTIVRGTHLRNGFIRSCGCYSREVSTKHGMHGTPIYVVWGDMIQRCTNPKQTGYSNYGGRGICVCDRWLDFAKFFADMGERPKGLTIERKNNELGYFKENCCWASYQAQGRNQRIRKDNKTGVRGVYFSKQNQRYCVQIKVNFKTQHIGSFATLPEAATARKEAEIKYW